MRPILRKSLLVFGLVALVGLVAAPSAFAQSNIVNLNFPCPVGFGTCNQLASSTSIGGFINSFYQIALAVAGLLALLMIVYGGIKYTISAGNTGAQEDARDIILSALYGVGLLLASYLILTTINPRITSNLNLPGTDIPAPPKPAESKVISVANTECIPLNSTTADQNNTSTISATATYASLVQPAAWDGVEAVDQGGNPTLNCAFRVGYVGSSSIDITNDHQYYDEGETIDAGDRVWMYPYFTDPNNPGSSAKCLIYAYQPNDSSSTPTMIDLNPTLQLCYPHDQQVALNPSAQSSQSGFGQYDPNALQAAIGCHDQSSCAAKYYYSGYVAGIAQDTSDLFSCIMSHNLTNFTSGPYSYQQTGNTICNYTRGNPATLNGQKFCVHAVNSCHYGGNQTGHTATSIGNLGSEAMDFDFNSGPNGAFDGAAANNFLVGVAEYCSQYVKQPEASGARCESSTGIVKCTDPSANHVHITVAGCNAN